MRRAQLLLIARLHLGIPIANVSVGPSNSGVPPLATALFVSIVRPTVAAAALEHTATTVIIVIIRGQRSQIAVSAALQLS